MDQRVRGRQPGCQRSPTEPGGGRSRHLGCGAQGGTGCCCCLWQALQDLPQLAAGLQWPGLLTPAPQEPTVQRVGRESRVQWTEQRKSPCHRLLGAGCWGSGSKRGLLHLLLTTACPILVRALLRRRGHSDPLHLPQTSWLLRRAKGCCLQRGLEQQVLQATSQRGAGHHSCLPARSKGRAAQRGPMQWGPQLAVAGVGQRGRQ